MPTTLSSLPKDLPELKDGTILTLPIEIGVATPVEGVKFYQSRAFLNVVPIILIYTIVNLIIGYYVKNPTSLVVLVVFVVGLIFSNSYRLFRKNPNDSSYIFDKKFTWKIEPILVLNKHNIVFNDYFDVPVKEVDLDDINYFVYSGAHIGFSIRYKSNYIKKLRTDGIKVRKWLRTPFNINHRFVVVNDESRMPIYSLVKLLNQIKDKQDDTVIYQKF